MTGDGPEFDGELCVTTEVHPDGGRSSLDAVLNALANQRRRYALYYLQDCTTATLREVAHQVAVWESNRPIEAIEPSPSDVVYADFYHRHLPKLADANVVKYDPREELVRYDCPETVERMLDIARWVESPEAGTD